MISNFNLLRKYEDFGNNYYVLPVSQFSKTIILFERDRYIFINGTFVSCKMEFFTKRLLNMEVKIQKDYRE
jgi:hypothetical protein